jgi:hypothetical protein
MADPTSTPSPSSKKPSNKEDSSFSLSAEKTTYDVTRPGVAVDEIKKGDVLGIARSGDSILAGGVLGAGVLGGAGAIASAVAGDPGVLGAAGGSQWAAAKQQQAAMQGFDPSTGKVEFDPEVLEQIAKKLEGKEKSSLHQVVESLVEENGRVTDENVQLRQELTAARAEVAEATRRLAASTERMMQLMEKLVDKLGVPE